MDIFPAIDLLEGKAVRLFQGDYKKVTVYSSEPAEVAKDFKTAGAEYLHLVDLDGARTGDTPNCGLIAEIVRTSGLKVEVGGGVRNMETVEKYLNSGVMRVIIGSAAVSDPGFLETAIKLYGEKIAVGVDLKDGKVAVNGWTQTSILEGFSFIDCLERMGVTTVICTDISKDGAMEGVNEQLYRRLMQRFTLDIIASGGITDISDLELLSQIGVRGAILGKSLYTGSINLSQAIKEIKK